MENDEKSEFFFSVIEFSAFNLDALHAIKLHKLKI